MKRKFDFVRAGEYMEKYENYGSAIHFYLMEIGRTGDKSVYTRLGDIYLDLGLISEAIKCYMKAYASDRHDPYAIRGLIDAYADIDPEASFYYMQYAMINGDGDEVNFDFDFASHEKRLEVHDRRDKSEAIEQVYKLIERGDHTEAKELLKTIGENSFQYGDARLIAATLSMGCGEFEAALKECDNALISDPLSVGAHVLKVMAYDSLGDGEKVIKWIKKLDELDVRDEDDVAKVIMCLSNFDEYELTEKYLVRKIEYTPFDKLILLIYASVEIKLGKKDNAVTALRKLSSIYPTDIEIKEMASLLMSGDDVAMPRDLLKFKGRWLKDIKELLTGDPKELIKPENKKKIMWLLSEENDLYLQSAVCSFVADMREYDDIIDDMMLDPFIPDLIKRQTLLRKVCSDRTKKVKFVIDNIYRSIIVRHPDADDNLKYAYYYALTSLAVTEIGFERRFYWAFKTVRIKYDECDDPEKKNLSIGVLASMIIYLMKRGSPGRVNHELFDCESEEFQKALTMLKI